LQVSKFMKPNHSNDLKFKWNTYKIQIFYQKNCWF
jgi:hypothetical protein